MINLFFIRLSIYNIYNKSYYVFFLHIITLISYIKDWIFFNFILKRTRKYKIKKDQIFHRRNQCNYI